MTAPANTREIDFLIVGAAKSATTWLQRTLQNDPKVAMPDPELHYFSRAFDRGDEWYLARFPDRPKGGLLGEKSNSYLDDAEAARRIGRAMPDVRLIAQLRDPVARAYSDYCMLYRRGEVDGDIDAHLDPRVAAGSRFLTLGRYAEQWERYAERFDPERLLLITFEETVREPIASLSRVHALLGLPTPQVGSLAERVKDKRARMIPLGARRHLAPLKPLVAPIRETRAFKALHRRVSAPIAYPPLDDALEKRLTDYFAPLNERLVRETGLDIGAWRGSASTTPAATRSEGDRPRKSAA